MQVYDKVKVLKDREEYERRDIHKGMIGTIFSGEIRDNSFQVMFELYEPEYEMVFVPIYIEDLELVEEGNAPDDWVLEELPRKDPRWWCRVKDGYILNFKGERKNKIPYDYNS